MSNAPAPDIFRYEPDLRDDAWCVVDVCTGEVLETVESKDDALLKIVDILAAEQAQLLRQSETPTELE